MASNTQSPYVVIEGQTAMLTCVVTDANPLTNVTYRWFNAEHPSKVLHNHPNYTIPYTMRNMSGFYNCIANNSVGKSNPVTVNLDIQCKYRLIFTLSYCFLCDDTMNQIWNMKFIKLHQ